MAGFSLKLKYATQWATLVAATLAVLGGIVTLGVLVQFYFAQQQGLRHTSCINFHRTNLLSMQMETGNAYARYINTKIKLLELSTKYGDSSEQEKERIITDAKLKRLWEEVTKLDNEADEYVRVYAEEVEKCSQSDEPLVWFAS